MASVRDSFADSSSLWSENRKRLVVAVPVFAWGTGIEACSLDTAVPSGGQAFADRLQFSSLCSKPTALNRFDCRAGRNRGIRPRHTRPGKAGLRGKFL